MARNTYYHNPHWRALKQACHKRDGWRYQRSGPNLARAFEAVGSYCPLTDDSRKLVGAVAYDVFHGLLKIVGQIGEGDLVHGAEAQ